MSHTRTMGSKTKKHLARSRRPGVSEECTTRRGTLRIGEGIQNRSISWERTDDMDTIQGQCPRVSP